MRDHYHVLNVGHTATAAEIHRAWRALARRYHPDRNPDASAATEMTRINEAYEWLGDPARRAAYDRRFVGAEPDGLRQAVLDAASDTIRASVLEWAWTGPDDGIMSTGSGRTAVRFIGLLGSVELERWRRDVDRIYSRSLAGDAVCVAYRVLARSELAVLASSGRRLTAIDLVEARACGAAFSGPAVRDVFETFLLDG